MSLSGMFANRVMKVSLEGELVRVNLEVPSTASAREVLSVMHHNVQRAFGLSDDQMTGLTLKYADEEGDLCTLTDATLSDLAELMPQGVIRLTAQVLADVRMQEVSSEEPEPVDMHVDAQEAEQDRASNSDETDAQSEAFSNPMAELAVQFLPFWLPAVATKLQGSEERAKMNRVGIEEREKVLPICKRLHERMSLVPEALHLRQRVSSYIDGTDSEHLGDLAAALLQAFNISSSPEGVKAVVKELVSCVMAAHLDQKLRNAFGGVFPGKGFGKSAGAAAASPMPDVFSDAQNQGGSQSAAAQPRAVPAAAPAIGSEVRVHGLTGGAHLNGLTGVVQGYQNDRVVVTFGEGAPQRSAALQVKHIEAIAPQFPETPAVPPAMPDIAGLLGNLGNLLGGKGAGKNAPGMAAAPGDLAGALGNLGSFFSGKGMGKGTAAQPNVAEVLGPLGQLFSGKGTSRGTAQAQANSPASAPAATSEALEQSAKDLVDMGLVADERVAKDLLHANNGDLSKVVDILTK